MGAGARILRGHPTHSTLSPEILKCWFIRVYARFVCLVCKYSEKKAQQKRNERKIKRKNERYVDETRKKNTHTQTAATTNGEWNTTMLNWLRVHIIEMRDDDRCAIRHRHTKHNGCTHFDSFFRRRRRCCCCTSIDLISTSDNRCCCALIMFGDAKCQRARAHTPISSSRSN